MRNFYNRYRELNRPNEDYDVFDPVPLFPPADAKRRGRKPIRDGHREIAWTIDYRGDNDDIPTLLFVGAGYTLIKKIFFRMFGKGSAVFNGFKLYRDYFHYQRQGKAWVRMAVELKNLNTDMLSLMDLGNIIERQIKQECLCEIKYVTLNKFLNI